MRKKYLLITASAVILLVGIPAILQAQTQPRNSDSGGATSNRNDTSADPRDNADADLPGALGLFFRDVGQKIQLIVTLDPVKDAGKRVEFAESNLKLADTILKASKDSKVQERAVDLVSSADNLVTTVNARQDKWSADADAVEVKALVDKIQTYFTTAGTLVQSIAQNANPDNKKQLEVLTADIAKQGTVLATFIQENFPGVEKIGPEKINNPVLVDKDQDRDGIDDNQEAELGIKATDFDTDGDGLSDRAEIEQHGTDPTKDDTDGDGFRDGLEVLKGYNPIGSGLLTGKVPTTSLKFLMNIKVSPAISVSTSQYIINVLKNYETKKK